jgi:hypothetical protein
MFHAVVAVKTYIVTFRRQKDRLGDALAFQGSRVIRLAPHPLALIPVNPKKYRQSGPLECHSKKDRATTRERLANEISRDCSSVT